ncbi:MAG TPA: acyl-CoA dehydrogenase family protein [Pseudonocardia sp.]|jgi:alkylation response protein AidB-like acyl-CoA dehydrogenase|nr:acyl-CoA dehydrogenase family protein [Pseudonocardia sp.]
MRLAFTDEQDSLRDTVRAFLRATCPESEVRRLMDTDAGFDAGVWTRFADLGVCGLTVPERLGGAGYSFVELGVVLEELGASLACLPFLSSVVLAQSLLMAIDDDGAQSRWMPGLASGVVRGTVAFAEGSGGWDGRGITTLAVRDGERWRLDGAKTFVLDGHTADLVLVLAETDADGLSVFAVEPDAPGVTRSVLETMDQTRKQASIELAGTPAVLVGTPGSGAAALATMGDSAAIALAVEAVGGASAVLEEAVEYAKVRVQFGRPIGSFQAIKHRCADMLLRVESARSAAYHAIWAASESSGEGDTDELRIAASMAKAYCTEAYAWAAAENIQIHGGIGFTWEHSAHLYFKRATSSRLLFGDPVEHRARLADLIGI